MEGVRQSLARVLAPLAILAFALALTLVLLQGGGGEASPPATPAGQVGGQEQAQSDNESADERQERRERREQQQEEEGPTYEVQPGDTLSSIAAEAGVEVEDLQAENPDLDAQTLSPGQEIRLPE